MTGKEFKAGRQHLKITHIMYPNNGISTHIDTETKRWKYRHSHGKFSN